jgi:Zn-dependent peptidase ImmA (M78 family)
LSSRTLSNKKIFPGSLYDVGFPLIVINNGTATTRQIFTLFHEFAHLLVHVNGVTKQDDRYVELLTGEPRRIEIFCNQLAAELLVPTVDLRLVIKRLGTDDESVGEIARTYKVSREVILLRLLNMQLITRHRYEKKAAEWVSEYEASVVVRKPSGNYYATQASYLSERYTRLAFGSYYRGKISLEQLADYLNVSAKSVPGLEQFVLQKAGG